MPTCGMHELLWAHYRQLFFCKWICLTHLCLYAERVFGKFRWVLSCYHCLHLFCICMHLLLTTLCFQHCNYYWSNTTEIENFWSAHVRLLCCHLFVLIIFIHVVNCSASFVTLLHLPHSGSCIPSQSDWVSHILNNSCHRLGTSEAHVCFCSI